MYRDFTYIDDVTKSIELLINKIPSQIKKNSIKMIAYQVWLHLE